MEPELQEFRSGKKSLELICYIAGAGAFGVFLRWMQGKEQLPRRFDPLCRGGRRRVLPLCPGL